CLTLLSPVSIFTSRDPTELYPLSLTRRSSDLSALAEPMRLSSSAAPSETPSFSCSRIRCWQHSQTVKCGSSAGSHSGSSASRPRSEEHTSELQSRENLVCRLLLEKKNELFSDE